MCKKNGRIVECCRLYERADKFNRAVSILCDNGVYDIALDILKRYKMRETVSIYRKTCVIYRIGFDKFKWNKTTKHL